MSRTLLFLAALTACMDDASPVDDVVKPTKEAAPTPPPAKTLTFEVRVGDARTAVLAREEGAVEAVQALLSEKPEEAALWRLLGYAARATGGEKALLDALSGAEPVGGKAGAHHLLRAELALAAGDAEAALTAARAAIADQPDAAAALMAEAARAGAVVPDIAGDKPDAAESLIRYAAASDRRGAARFAAEAATVAGWRAAVLRARVALAHGEAKAAAAALAGASEATDPRAMVAVGLLESELALAGALPEVDGVKPGVYAAAVSATAALQAALDDGDAATAGDNLDRVIGLALRGNASAAGLAIAEAVVAGVADGAVAPRLTLARVALAAGRPAVAKEAAAAARAAAEGELAADAAWLEGWGALGVGDVDGATTAAGGLSGARAQAIRALALGYAGAPSAVVGGLPTSGLSDRDAAYTWLEAGLLGGPLSAEALKRAVRAADAARDPALGTQARLALERQLREFDDRGAASLRAELLKRAPRGAEGDALRAEVATRSLLAGGRFAGADGAAGPAAEWAALAAGDRVSSPVSPVGKWANGRAAARAGEAAASLRYAESLSELPTHRRGLLSTGTAQLGAHGLPVAIDLGLVEGKGLDDAALASVLTVHEAAHRVDAARADHAQGRDLLAGLDAEQRASLLGAAAHARAQVRDHLASGGAFPTDAVKALSDAEAALATDTPLKNIFPAAPLSLGQVRKDLGGAALLSYVASAGSVHGLVVKLDGGSALRLGAKNSWVADSSAHLRALQASARVEAKADHRAGDRLREALIDPFVAELAGVGRYQVIAPMDVMGFSVTTFPEQSSGLRYLADIRTVATLPTILEVHRDDEGNRGDLEYRPPFLGFGAPEKIEPKPEGAAEGEAGGEAPAGDKEGALSDEDLLRAHRAKSTTPGALSAASRSFGDDFRDLRVGEAATEAVWNELGGTARYLQISAVDAAPDGGFVLADGDLTLSEIRSTEMRAQVVVVTAEASHGVQIQRARAFLDAGAAAVLIMAWPVEEAAQERFFDGYFAALNRDRPPARALNEARESLMRDALLGVDNDDPGLWGSMLLLSNP